ncbi:MAG TPA: VanZ family protein [Candidatus Anaerobutyricum avicola]|nr:VanZ family protein [Candidatus Anaerobutyricum avicola]
MDILKKITRKRIGSLSFFLLIIYACVVLYFVLFSDRLGRVEGYSTYRYNLIPFVEIRRFILYRDYVSRGAFLLNLVGNLLVFFPVGMLVPLWRTKKTGFIRILIYTFLFTLCIETLQLVTKVGVFDVDDLLMNTLGGLAGWLCYCLALRVFRFVRARGRKKSKKKEE